MKTLHLAFLLILIVALASCGKHEPDTTDKPTDKPLTDSTHVKGYGLFNHITGIWDGPVTSSTPLGSYPTWIVDFRPVSAAQVSGKAELDTVNDIFMGFFIAKRDTQYIMCFRNGGGFAGLQRVSYASIDSVKETATEAYYRFVDFVAGESRLYVEFRFRNDSLDMKTYTSKYNSVSPPVLHMHWTARRVDTSSTQDAITEFSFPQKQLVKDFSTAFDGLTEAVFYGLANDPYPQSEHPYLGETSIQASLGGNVQTQPGGRAVLIITTQPLFNGVVYQPGNLKFRSRYVLLSDAPYNYTFDYMHPGSYYLNAFYDTNGDTYPQSGEYLSYPFDQAFSLSANGTASKSVQVSFEVP